MASADALKAEGNALFAAKDFQGAAEKFSEAIGVDPSNHVLYSNLSGAYASLKDYQKALEAATKTTELKADWSKGWGRKGAALHGTGDLIGAVEAFEEALKLDANNAQAKSGLAAVNRAIEQEARGDGIDPSGGLGNMFNDPKLIEKLAANPKTSGLLADGEFMQKLQNMKNNPQAMQQDMFSDPRFLQVMGVLMGVDMNFAATNDADAAAKKFQAEHDGDGEDVDMPDAGRPKPTEQKKAPEPEPEPEPEDEEAIVKKQAKAEADKEKALGTENYKKRNFDEAIAHYTKAWETHKDITYLTNLSAAHFEKGDYAACIETCKQAIEYGREVYADFKLIAKAFGRMGSAYEKQGDYTNAVEYYNRSLTEHRTPEILAKLRAAEKTKITSERDAYIDPVKAEEARELGNQKFKELDWPAAVDAYTEMTKRAPNDPRGFSNRAACLIKLLTLPSAVADCDEAIKRDKNFIRAYLRKAQALFLMKEFNKCLDVCAEASEHDIDGKNAREIEQQQQKALQAQFSAREGETDEQAQERIQRDPDIMAILQDPVMQSILQQAKGDPAALQDHMKNPAIAMKVQKLMAAGVIRMGGR
ncbi:probable molecular co-chaperone STI1 [Ramularia collo-cygni]|uniref:Probable molecular co-chaperone STI1 n=1 Tax=Ramularia collo-cygni TaxID=112498 RepID=A0A2D3UZ85_9PEZI|nr:probable molecular co-chaperone STI1 [Ramularia collo-cygni]CZT20798.1 probable molecular co-chaperone STI1 [Ramularia collo-cygni]